jgi:hypothetical protein
MVRAGKFAAFQANIVAYSVANLSWACNGRIDFDMIWTRQSISPELHAVLENWVVQIDKALRNTAGNRMVSEWAKKVECRDTLREMAFALPDRLPPELSSEMPAAGRRSTRSRMRNDEIRL